MKLKRILSGLAILVLMILVGCFGQTENTLTLEQVVSSLQKQGLHLHKEKHNPMNAFQRKLSGVRPKVFLVKEGTLSIYIFPSKNERKTGQKDFKRKTAAASLAFHKVYVLKNVLIFYTEDTKTVNKKIQQAIKKLSQQKNVPTTGS